MMQQSNWKTNWLITWSASLGPVNVVAMLFIERPAQHLKAMQILKSDAIVHCPIEALRGKNSSKCKLASSWLCWDTFASQTAFKDANMPSAVLHTSKHTAVRPMWHVTSVQSSAKETLVCLLGNLKSRTLPPCNLLVLNTQAVDPVVYTGTYRHMGLLDFASMPHLSPLYDIHEPALTGRRCGTFHCTSLLNSAAMLGALKCRAWQQ